MTSWADFNEDTQIQITAGNFLFEKNLSEADAKSLKLNGDKGGSAKFTVSGQENGVVALKWNDKGILTMTVKMKPNVNSYLNAIDLSENNDGNGAGKIDCTLAIADDYFEFIIPYAGKKTCKLYTIKWSVKGCLK